jgi:hypothetical protein
MLRLLSEVNHRPANFQTMNANNLLSPALLHAMAIFIVTLTVVQVAAYTGVIALAARRTALAPRAQFALPLMVAGFLAAWLAWAALAVQQPVVTPEPPPIAADLNLALLLKMGVFFSLGVAALTLSKSLRAVYAATPPAWLIGVQIYRVAGLMFLWPFLAYRALPTSFATIAGVGDMLVGLAALPVVLALIRKQPRAHAYAVAWNYLGILDFVSAVTAAVLSGSTNIGHFPLVIVQVFIVPLGILAHITSLLNLSATRGSVPVGGTPILNNERQSPLAQNL